MPSLISGTLFASLQVTTCDEVWRNGGRKRKEEKEKSLHAMIRLEQRPPPPQRPLASWSGDRAKRAPILRAFNPNEVAGYCQFGMPTWTPWSDMTRLNSTSLVTSWRLTSKATKSLPSTFISPLMADDVQQRFGHATDVHSKSPLHTFSPQLVYCRYQIRGRPGNFPFGLAGAIVPMPMPFSIKHLAPPVWKYLIYKSAFSAS